MSFKDKNAAKNNKKNKSSLSGVDLKLKIKKERGLLCGGNLCSILDTSSQEDYVVKNDSSFPIQPVSLKTISDILISSSVDDSACEVIESNKLKLGVARSSIDVSDEIPSINMLLPDRPDLFQDQLMGVGISSSSTNSTNSNLNKTNSSKSYKSFFTYLSVGILSLVLLGGVYWKFQSLEKKLSAAEQQIESNSSRIGENYDVDFKLFMFTKEKLDSLEQKVDGFDYGGEGVSRELSYEPKLIVPLSNKSKQSEQYKKSKKSKKIKKSKKREQSKKIKRPKKVGLIKFEKKKVLSQVFPFWQDNPFVLTKDMYSEVEKYVQFSDYHKSKAVFDWMKLNIVYGDSDRGKVGYRTAEEVFNSGQGVCGEQAILYITLCRSLGIKSKYVSVKSKIEDMYTHAIAQVEIKSELGIGKKKIYVDLSKNQFDAYYEHMKPKFDFSFVDTFTLWRKGAC
ncbi:transglutaminase domain-containing protein [Candidatus Woesearchaeota archaeon]|nr:transglutaminase domain-containing protein [Candidatus Woesearchaeota archaeon]